VIAAGDVGVLDTLGNDAPTTAASTIETQDTDTAGIEAELASHEAEDAQPPNDDAPATNLPARPTGKLPHYRCHKEVLAIEIASVEPWRDGEYIITPKDDGAMPFEVDANWFDHHQPQAGGFVVLYGDDYMSFSPRGAFVDGYTRIGTVEQVSTTQKGQGEGAGST